MNGAKIIFIGGIHGVGKGRICQELCADESIEYLSASKLIKWEEVSPDVKNKKVVDIPDTQDRLINALKSNCKEGKTYLLDGHYCLLDSNSKINRISEEVFSIILPEFLIIVSAEPEIVIQRLNSRDGKHYDHRLIAEMLEQEFKHSMHLSKALNLEHYHISTLNRDETITQIKAKT